MAEDDPVAAPSKESSDPYSPDSIEAALKEFEAEIKALEPARKRALDKLDSKLTSADTAVIAAFAKLKSNLMWGEKLLEQLKNSNPTALENGGRRARKTKRVSKKLGRARKSRKASRAKFLRR